METATEPFLEALHAWEAFYLMAGTAAVTLVGLLFVALAMHVAVLFRPEHARTRALAFHAFQGYLYVLLTALIFLAPPRSLLLLGLTYVAMNLALLVSALLRLRLLLPADPASGRRGGARLWGVVFPGVGYGTGLLLGLRIANEGIPPGNLLMLPPLLVLAASTRTAWMLLENVGRLEADARDRATAGLPPPLVSGDEVE